MQGGTAAETQLYSVAAGRLEWSPCRVIAYDAEQRAYEALLPSSGGALMRKLVKRLNLRFQVGRQIQGVWLKW